MIGLFVKTEDRTKRVSDAADKAAFRNFGHAAARIMKDMKASLEKQEGPSDPGSPPHTHKGIYLRRAVRFDATKTGAVIGPIASLVGDVGATHEFGETRDGVDYPERPFAEPALEKNLSRFASDWAGSVTA